MSGETQPRETAPARAPDDSPGVTKRAQYGPARVGSQAYPWRRRSWSEVAVGAELTRRACDPGDTMARARALLDDPQRMDDAARLQQRALLIDLGESDRLIPWHARELDARAWAWAVELWLCGAAPHPTTAAEDTSADADVTDRHAAIRKAALKAAAAAFADIHADQRLHDETNATTRNRDLAHGAAAAKQCGDAGLMARYDAMGVKVELDWTVDLSGDGADTLTEKASEGAAAALTQQLLAAGDLSLFAEDAHALATTVATRLGDTAVLEATCTADVEAAVDDELALERRRALYSRSIDVVEDHGAHPIGGTLIWTGSKLRLGLLDTQQTFMPEVVRVDNVGGRDFPAGRIEAMAMAAWRLTSRGPVVLVCATERGLMEAADALLYSRMGPDAVIDAGTTKRRSKRRLSNERIAALRAVGVALLDTDQDAVESGGMAGAAPAAGDRGAPPRLWLTTPQRPTRRWPKTTAVVLTAPESGGLPITQAWLRGASRQLMPWPPPLVLVGIDGRRARERVVREVTLAEALLAWQDGLPSPLVRLLLEALPPRDSVHTGAAEDASDGADPTPNADERAWLEVFLTRAALDGPADPRRTAAWRSTRDPRIHALLTQAWRAHRGWAG